jgi:arsenate reductase-like glutaredoxin family protein
LTWTNDSRGKKVVVDYLSGEITKEELMEILKARESEPDFRGEVVE